MLSGAEQTAQGKGSPLESGATPALMPGRGELQHRELSDACRGLGWLYFEGSCCCTCGQRQWAGEPSRCDSHVLR